MLERCCWIHLKLAANGSFKSQKHICSMSFGIGLPVHKYTASSVMVWEAIWVDCKRKSTCNCRVYPQMLQHRISFSFVVNIIPHEKKRKLDISTHFYLVEGHVFWFLWIELPFFLLFLLFFYQYWIEPICISINLIPSNRG